MHLPDAVVLGVGDVQIADRVDRDADGRVEVGRRARDPVAVVARRARPGDGIDDAARGRHLPHAVVARVGDVEIARSVHRHAPRAVELRRRGLAAVTAVSAHACAGDGRDVARALRHLADAVIVVVRDVDVPRRVHRHAEREVQLRQRGRCAITG